MSTRRAFLRWGALAGLVTATPVAAVGGYAWVRAGRSNVGRVRFERRLHIPPLLAPARGADGTVRFDLTAGTGTTELLPGRSTPTWGVNGSYLGPTLRARRGDTVAVRLRNDLPEPTTLHWHGMELPAVADGGPHNIVAPGGTWQPRWRIDQPASTLWYHPHPHGTTKEHVYRGVAGLFLVDDESDPPLPREYGVDDIPVILQDKNVTDGGALDLGGIAWSGLDVVGLLGTHMFVNGTWGPVLPVTTERVRLRVLNAGNARVYDLALGDGRTFHLVGTDCGLLAAPREVDHVRVSPGERVELLVTVRPGERLLLHSRPPELDANMLFDRLSGGDDTFEVLRLDAADTLRPSPPVPTALPAAPAVPRPSGATRTFRLGEVHINDNVMDLARLDAVVPRGAVERWLVHNDNTAPHNFHVHNAAFEVTDVDGRPAPAEYGGRKDTVYVGPGRRVGLAVSFGAYADPRTPYMFHCHLLAHEDAGMMGQFVIVAPGTEDDVPRDIPTPHHGHP